MIPKLLFVVNVDWFFLSHRLPIALEAQRQGYQVHIATFLTDKLDEIQGHGFVVHPLIAMDRNSTSLGKALRTMIDLWKIFRAVRPNVVHLVTTKPVLLGGLVARLSGVPSVVVAVAGLGLIFTDRGVKAVILRFVVGGLYRVVLGHRNLKVVFQNSHDRATLSNLTYLPASKVVMIRGSGVDLLQYDHSPLPQGIPVILFAARLLSDKGVGEFVQAAKIFKQRGVSARFCLVGKVDPFNPNSLTESELALWANEGVVELWGHRLDMPQVLAAANIVTLPSYYGEGLPKVLLEAAACGRAVVTTDHPGCRDAIEPGVSGILVPIRDATALANSLEVLINDPERCLTMGNEGRYLAERAFDVRQVAAAHLRIYEELIGNSWKYS